MAAHEKWSRHDPKEGTSAARAAWRGRFERQVRDEATARGEELTEQEVARRAESALKAHMTRLAYRSAKARRIKAADELEREVAEEGSK
jgi:hypothetical protein